MRSVAKRLILGMFASAPANRFLGIDLGDNGAKWRAAVRAVTEGLVVRLAAGAPGVFARFHFHDIRPSLGDLGFVHKPLL